MMYASAAAMTDFDGTIDRVTQRLRRLRHGLPEILAAFVLTADGLPVSAVTRIGVDEEMVAAASAALLGLARKMARVLQQGRLNQMVIQGGDQDFVIAGGPGDAVLAAVLEKGSNIGLVAVDVQRAAAEVLELV
jgi:predicted regulator of Ras-like GTPase activity (Roadblock/LC7/MglB family)